MKPSSKPDISRTSSFFTRAMTLLTLVCFCFAAQGQPDSEMNATAMKPTFTEGVDYKILAQPIPALVYEKATALRPAAVQITIYEFFSYACIWCFKIEKHVAAWQTTLSPKEIKFEKVPVAFRRDWRTLAEMYYMIENTSEVANATHQAVFRAIHEEKVNFSKKQTIYEFLVNAFRFDPDSAKKFDELTPRQQATVLAQRKQEFKQYFYSPRIDKKVSVAEGLATKYQIRAIPTFIIGGTYETNIQMANGDPERLMQIVDYIATDMIQKIKAGKPVLPQ